MMLITRIIPYSLLVSVSFFTFYSSTPSSSQPLLPPYSGRLGHWDLLHESVGISVMHMQVLHNNKVIMFDRTDYGPSNITLSGGRCRYDPHDMALVVDCYAHSILYDIPTNTFRPLMVQTDTWCSSGAVLANGTFIQTGGYNDGDHKVRAFTTCSDDISCDWIETRNNLSRRRWYASNHILPDGRIIIVGGRLQFNYEFYPVHLHPRSFQLPFLRHTRDGNYENNLYPFLHLLPDGNLFVFANTRSILLDYNRNQVVREFPPIPDGASRNYPSSGSSVLLPLDENANAIEAEVLICGGAPRGSYQQALDGNYGLASSSCGRLVTTDPNPSWAMEEMPIARVMGDMLLLPTGDILIVSGAQLGTAGWETARDPVTRPVIYRPLEQQSWRFAAMSAASRPRMYHSSAVLLPDGRVLVGGSNPHRWYNFTGVLYPTELSLEAFSPPYISMEHERIRPRIVSPSSIDTNVNVVRYGRRFWVRFQVGEYLGESVVSVRIVAPSFTTHSFAMNQRMVVLKMAGIAGAGAGGAYKLSAVGPSKPEIAPPGYYMLFVVHAGIPSPALWVTVQ